MTATQQQPVETAPVKRGWWRRNWKRLIGGIFVVALLAAGGVYYHFFGRIMLSTPFKMAWGELQKSKLVAENLGEPIRGGWTPHGMVTSDDNLPEAQMMFTISGPKGSGDVSVRGRQIKGEWGFHEFIVTLADGKKVDLVPEIYHDRPSDVPAFDGNKQQQGPKIEQAPADLNRTFEIPDVPADK